ncbi:hypothetical protein AVEN_198592-1 [Araneus ventricosus]|uniref:Uncharacterized protein n=1 Tax=Araneus ventricosus TaxID=182803 RepID=A0A4Y2VQ70_ARAVE|nr:hypothetical protein AVEN_198592-1 [Araneus ventricosus]
MVSTNYKVQDENQTLMRCTKARMAGFLQNLAFNPRNLLQKGNQISRREWSQKPLGIRAIYSNVRLLTQNNSHNTLRILTGKQLSQTNELMGYLNVKHTVHLIMLRTGLSFSGSFGLIGKMWDSGAPGKEIRGKML